MRDMNKRRSYQRRWIAAKRALKKLDNEINFSDSSSSSDAVEKRYLCHWPPPPKIPEKLVKKETEPNKNKWPQFEVRVLTSPSNFDEDVRLNPPAEDTLNFDSDDDSLMACPVVKRRKIQSNKYPYESCVTQSSSAASSSALLRTPLSMKDVKSSTPTSVEENESTSTGGGVRDILKTILMKLDEVIETQKEHTKILRQLQDSKISRPNYEDMEHILPHPIATMEAMTKFHEDLKDADLRRKLVLKLSSLGGSSLGRTARAIIRRVAENKVWGCYSAHGRKNKLALSDHRIWRVFLQSCKIAHRGESEVSIGRAIGEAIKSAPFAKGGEFYQNRKKGGDKSSGMLSDDVQCIDE